MKPSFSDSTGSLTELVSFLATQQDTILKNWRSRCDQDPFLTNVAPLSRTDFTNSMPNVLTTLRQRLLGQTENESIAQLALDHGLQRRYKAHLIRETVRELNHLTQALYDELPHFQALFPNTDPSMFWAVQQHMTQIMADIIDGSIQVYDELQRAEAACRAAILQKGVDQMDMLSRERSEKLRASMHDLRGGWGIISGAASLLRLEGLSEIERADYLALLSRNLISVQVMMANLMDLSRLDAGQENLQIETLNVAGLLTEMVHSVQPLANQKGLVVAADGPETLQIETDRVKLQRIVQNLLLNALKYTFTGFVRVSWTLQQGDQWLLQIQDSGPGLPLPILTYLNAGVSAGSRPAELSSAAPVGGVSSEGVAESGFTQPVSERSWGDGIGLRIVNAFSQRLKAKLLVETAPGQGTCFSLWFPIRF
ncbi:hypothetical protein GCM10028805_36960 [Spirosoma harenae]